MIFGQRQRWAIEITPLAGPPTDPDQAATATWAQIRLWANGNNLTAHTRTETAEVNEGLNWPAVYLARWFLHAWDGLWNRHGWPLAGFEGNPEAACRKLDKYIQSVDPDNDFLDRRDDFVTSHALLAAAGGGVMPSVYLARDGADVRVVWRPIASGPQTIVFHAASGTARVQALDFLAAVDGFLQWTATAVRQAEPALATKIAAWHAALQRPESALAVLQGYVHSWAVATQDLLPTPWLQETLGLAQGWDAAGAAFMPQTAAPAMLCRAVAPVMDARDIATILARLAGVPTNPNAASKLEKLALRLSWSEREADYRQGYQLATQLREIHENSDGFIDVEKLLSDLGVVVHEEALGDPHIDGIVAWSDSCGPLILVNSSGRYFGAPWSRRMTLAHELCHLLVDRNQARAVILASTPWAPPVLERRANAFAAELLLPLAGIRRLLPNAWTADDVAYGDRARLMDEFKVGDLVCSQHLINRLR